LKSGRSHSSKKRVHARTNKKAARKPEPIQATATIGSSDSQTTRTPEDAFIEVLRSAVVDLSRLRDDEKLALDGLVARLSQLSDLASKASADMHAATKPRGVAPHSQAGFLVI
jgi:hypothetical protein